MAKAIDEQVAEIAYLRSSNFLRTWNVRQGTSCEIDGVALSMARPAPRVLHGVEKTEVSPRATRTVPAAKGKSDDPYVNLLDTAIDAAEAMGKFSRWLKTPPPSAPPKPAITAPAATTPPPFDIQDIPGAMRKLGMPMSARLQERWFAGKVNYSKSSRDLRNEINQNGGIYFPQMVDSTIVKMEWILSFRRAKHAFDELVQKNLSTPGAIDALRKNLTPYMAQGEVFAWESAESNLLKFHNNFQFQHINVNSSWAQRIGEYLNREVVAGGVPDDLTGALGTFSFYAAIRYAWFDSLSMTAIVPEVSVYVRDPYEFSDDQYLGHWSRSHVAVVPAFQMANGRQWLDYPVADRNAQGKDKILYPVTNKSYRDWRDRHGQGGDFIIYTDRMNIKINPPIQFSMRNEILKISDVRAACARWMVAAIAAGFLTNYAIDANLRMTRGVDCVWDPIPNPKDSPYYANFCYLTKDTVVLRVFDAKDDELLVERTYRNSDLGRFYWKSDALGYDTFTGDSIALPPTLLDRLLAKFP